MPELLRPDGCRLYFETHGRRDAEPMVLLEGMGGDIPGWRRNIPHLAIELFVIAYDFRGNGRSDAPDEPVTMATFVDDTLAVLDHLGVDSGHVYGQSFGGMVALDLALGHPHRVRSLVLAATHIGGDRVVPVRAKVPKDRPWLALYSPGFAHAHPDHVQEDVLVGSQRPQKPHAGRRQWEAMRAFDAHDRGHALTIPTLVLQGTDDRLVAVENARILSDLIPGAELVLLEGAGHVYHSEQPDRADTAVLDFVRRHARG